MADGTLSDSISESIKAIALRVDGLSHQFAEERALRIETDKLVSQVALGFIQQPLPGSPTMKGDTCKAVSFQSPTIYNEDKSTDVSMGSSSDRGSDGDDEQDHVKRVTYWRYVPNDGKDIMARRVADIMGEKVGKRITAGSVLEVTKEVYGADGVLFLQLAEGGGWLFDKKPGFGTLCVRHEEEESSEGVNLDYQKLSRLFTWLKSAMTEQADRTTALQQRFEELSAAQASTQQILQNVREHCQQDFSNISGVVSNIGRDLAKLTDNVQEVGDLQIKMANGGIDSLLFKNENEDSVKEIKHQLERLEVDIASQSQDIASHNQLITKLTSMHEVEADRVSSHYDIFLTHDNILQKHAEYLEEQRFSLDQLYHQVLSGNGRDSSPRVSSRYSRQTPPDSSRDSTAKCIPSTDGDLRAIVEQLHQRAPTPWHTIRPASADGRQVSSEDSTPMTKKWSLAAEQDPTPRVFKGIEPETASKDQVTLQGVTTRTLTKCHSDRTDLADGIALMDCSRRPPFSGIFGQPRS